MDSREEKRDRLLESAMAVLEGAPDRTLNVTVLNKALFYLDLIALRDLGDTVTHATYLALHQGPVIAKYESRLVGALDKEGLAKQDSKGSAKPIQATGALPSFKYLTPAERVIAERVGRHAGERTSGQMSARSHGEAWQMAYDAGLGVGRPPKPVNLHMALQQIGDDDGWLEEPADESVRTAVEHAEQQSLFPW